MKSAYALSAFGEMAFALEHERGLVRKRGFGVTSARDAPEEFERAVILAENRTC